MSAAPVTGTARAHRAWEVLDTVPDPEVPALSVCDLGIVREVIDCGEFLEVVLTPTYSGCPATEVIERSIIDALIAAELGPVRATLRRAPAWTTDWITARGRERLRVYGIAPPCSTVGSAARPLQFVRRGKVADRPPCPLCGSPLTEQIAAFGSTACKALHRCNACREPFEYFKPI